MIKRQRINSVKRDLVDATPGVMDYLLLLFTSFDPFRVWLRLILILLPESTQSLRIEIRALKLLFLRNLVILLTGVQHLSPLWPQVLAGFKSFWSSLNRGILLLVQVGGLVQSNLSFPDLHRGVWRFITLITIFILRLWQSWSVVIQRDRRKYYLCWVQKWLLSPVITICFFLLWRLIIVIQF